MTRLKGELVGSDAPRMVATDIPGVASHGDPTTFVLPTQWPYQVALHSWLASIRIEDVQISPTPLVWDGYSPDVDALADLWLSLSNNPDATLSTRGAACWFVLDDGNGCGIEATGLVRVFYKGSASNTGAYGSDPAFWYQLDVPLAGGGQGNYYYRNPAVARRALIITAVEMMMWDNAIDRFQDVARNDYYGKALSSWAYAFHNCKEVLDAPTRAAFEAGFARFLDHTLRLGARDVNTNMDMFFVHGAAGVYATVGDPDVKSKAVQSVRRVLFGSADGNLDGRYDVIEGTFFPAGYIGEANGPETTYNGHSYAQLVGALSAVHGDSAWSFLHEVVRRMSLFKVSQYFPDPAVQPGKRPFYEGPAGYANRTGGSYVRDQGMNSFRDLTAADLVQEALPLARSYVSASNLRTESEMKSAVTKFVRSINEKSFALVDNSTAPAFTAYSSWPPDRAYLPPKGWYGRLSALLAADDPSTFVPYERAGHFFSKAFGGPATGTEFWAHKGNDGVQDFGFFVEADAQQGPYKGWYGGKLETFWTKETGILILNRHNKSGCDPAENENSTCWNEIETWAAHHVWGRDESGSGFSTAQIRGLRIGRTATVEVSTATPFTEVANYFNDAGASGSAHSGEQSGGELTGAFSVTNRFEALDDGIRITHRIASDRTDQASELWATIPVYLRWNHAEQYGQASLTDATIEYWDGGGWAPLTTELVTTDRLRIGRTYLDGLGARYGYVGFLSSDGSTAAARRVKLSPSVWEQSYQGYARIRNVHIDLHGNPGVATSLPAEASLTYTVTTTEPGAGGGAKGQQIDLKAGWNLVSLNVLPADLRLSTLFAGMSGTLVVKSEAGQVYNPELGFDEIGTWDLQSAYLVMVGVDSRLTIAGDPISPAEKAIAMKAGWNLVPYFGRVPRSIEGSLSSILPYLTLIKDHEGNVYAPAYNVNTIGSLQPGRGYHVLLTQDAVLTYP